jgi:predicted nucleotidyltransferase
MLTARDFGLQEKHLAEIISILQRYSEIKKAVIFGSRATKTHKAASDIDLALWFHEAFVNAESGQKIISRILADFEESSLPYFVDVVDYIHVNSNLLRTNIDRDGKMILCHFI